MADTPTIPAAPTAADRAAAAMRWTICILLAIYIAPLVFITFELLWTSFKQDRLVLRTFIGIAATSDQSYGILHRALLPLMGGLAPLAFRDESASRTSLWIMGILLVGILLSVLLSGAFGSETIEDELRKHTLFKKGVIDLTNDAAKHTAFVAGLEQVKGFLNRTQEAMAMYLLLLFGLQLEKAVPKK